MILIEYSMRNKNRHGPYEKWILFCGQFANLEDFDKFKSRMAQEGREVKDEIEIIDREQVMSKFKIGDRVVVVDSSLGQDAKVGQVGTVLEESTVPWTVFDEPTGFNRLPRAGIRGAKEGHMDALYEGHLESYKDPAMNKPHKWHKEIVAFAEGRAIQECNDATGGGWEDVSPDEQHILFNAPNYRFRIKPKTLRYRVAVMRSGTDLWTACSERQDHAEKLQSMSEFVEWVHNDWQEVEVES